MGIDVRCFFMVLEAGYQEKWETETIDWSDVNEFGEPRVQRRSLDAAGGLGLVLHFLNSTMLEVALQHIFGLVPSAVSCYLRFSMRLLAETLEHPLMLSARIAWPTAFESFEHLAGLIARRRPQLAGGFGFVDGVHLPVEVAGEENLQNAYYNGWLCSHFINKYPKPLLHNCGCGIPKQSSSLGPDQEAIEQRVYHLAGRCGDGFRFAAV